MVELIIVLLVILIGSPIVSLVLLARYSKLRTQLSESQDEHRRQISIVQREVAELKKQMASFLLFLPRRECRPGKCP